MTSSMLFPTAGKHDYKKTLQTNATAAKNESLWASENCQNLLLFYYITLAKFKFSVL